MSVIDDAMAFLRIAKDADSENRQEALTDVRFRDGQQWPVEIQNSRRLENRPCLTINKVDAYCTQVSNQQRQQRPRIKVDPTGGRSTKKVADVIQGMVRHIENNRGAGDLAYDNGFDNAITGGVGYWRILADYCRPDAFEQELYIEQIENPFSVYWDPNDTSPDGQDCEEVIVTDFISKKAFRRLYPGKNDGSNFNSDGAGDDMSDWLTEQDIRIAEYYCIKHEKARLIQLVDGTTFFEDEPPSNIPVNAMIGRERMADRRRVKWYKLTGMEVLEQRDLPGRWIPIVRIVGKTAVVDGKRKRKGLVRNARDPARMYNFWRTALTESVALAPKAKWVLAEGQIEGHEKEWETANTSSFSYLTYKDTTVDGKPAPPPQRLQPEPPPEGVLVAAQTINDDLSSVLGIVEPAMRIGGNVSGKALNAEKQQSDNSTFNFYDNMTRSIAQTGRILLDLIPHYYAEPGRITRILGDDGKSKVVTLNEQNPSPGPDTPGPVEAVLNDVTVGEYAVVMDTGPGYMTKRQAAVDAMMPLVERNEQLMQVAGDLIFRNMDFPGAEMIADRLAAANPLAQIDEISEIPPGVQMKIKQMQQVIQQQGQQMQAMGLELKHKAGIEQMKQEGETRRELIKATSAVHVEQEENDAWMREVESRDATKRHDTIVKATTALSVAEINAVRELLKTSVNNAHDLKVLEKTANQEEAEVKAAE